MFKNVSNPFFVFGFLGVLGALGGKNYVFA
jgi:hypothetical protein